MTPATKTPCIPRNAPPIHNLYGQSREVRHMSCKRRTCTRRCPTPSQHGIGRTILSLEVHIVACTLGQQSAVHDSSSRPRVKLRDPLLRTTDWCACEVPRLAPSLVSASLSSSLPSTLDIGTPHCTLRPCHQRHHAHSRKQHTHQSRSLTQQTRETSICHSRFTIVCIATSINSQGVIQYVSRTTGKGRQQ